MVGITKKKLKEYLKQKSKEELIKEIIKVCTTFESVRDYYMGKINPEADDKIIQKYKAIIKEEFFPSWGFGKARLSVARKAISDYKKVSFSKKGLADIMLFYVEMGVAFTNFYGDINAPFYDSMESMYERALKYIDKNGIKAKFRKRCKVIVDDTEGIGWGFHDGLSEIYYEYFKET